MTSRTLKSLALMLLLTFAATASAQWTYRTTEDKMRESKTRFAELNSSNKAQLGFPYRGGSTLQLIVFKATGGDTKIVLFLDRGQVPCHSDCKISTKFDDDEVKDWEGTGPASGRSDAVFVDDAAEFLARLKTAEKLIVEVAIYDHGRVQFTYNVRGLKWE